MPSGVTHTFFVQLGIILILVLGFYSGMSGRARTVYIISLCVVSLFSSRFTACALVCFSNFLRYLKNRIKLKVSQNGTSASHNSHY
jgi:hypothetical protein